MRGKLKLSDLKVTVGDNVEFETINDKEAVIDSILPRVSYMKRPKVSNISQIIFVISPKMPNPNLLVLDKELIYAEFLKIKPIIVINKIDLSEKTVDEIYELYKSIGYEVFKTNCMTGEGIDKIKKLLKNNTSAFARTIWSAESLL